MTTKKKKPKSRNYHLAIPFEQEARCLPAAQRPTFRAHLRRFRLRRPTRTFWLIDEVGRRHRL